MFSLAPLLEEIQAIAVQVSGLSRSINAQSDELPQINARVNSTLASLDDVMCDLRETSPQLPIARRPMNCATTWRNWSPWV